eukprot:gene26639-35313_t
MSQQAITLSDAPLPKLKVRALVIFSILNSYIRRSTREARVIGALLGEIGKDGSILVTDSFAVPYTEKLEDLSVTINQEYFRTMYACHRRNNKKEVIVGWYGTTTLTGEYIVDTSSLIHDFFSKECDECVHLVVDTTLATDKLNCRGFINRQHSIKDLIFTNAFQDIATTIEMTDAEATCVYHMLHGRNEDIGQKWTTSDTSTYVMSPGETVAHSIGALSSQLEEIQKYVDAVVRGDLPASRDVGIALSEALNSLSKRLSVLIHLMFILSSSSSNQSTMQDLLMVSYLSSLTQTQTIISEKLNQLL